MYQHVQPEDQYPDGAGDDQEHLLQNPHPKTTTRNVKILVTICASQLVLTIFLVFRSWSPSWDWCNGDMRATSDTWGTGTATEYWQLREKIRTVQTSFVNPIRPNYTAGTWDIEYAEGQRRYTGPPSDEIERSWEHLMAAINFNVSGELATPVEGDTFQYPDGHYLLGLEVFHGLHCVNIMRRTLSSGALHANSTMDDELWAKHVCEYRPYLFQPQGNYESAYNDPRHRITVEQGTAWIICANMCNATRT